MPIGRLLRLSELVGMLKSGGERSSLRNGGRGILFVRVGIDGREKLIAVNVFCKRAYMTVKMLGIDSTRMFL